MGVYAELINFNDLFAASKRVPLIINDFSEASADDKEAFNRLVYTRYQSEDLLSNLPSCECGETTGEYNLGTVCRNCDHPVVSSMDQDLEPLVWIRAPIGVRALMNPTAYTMLNDRFTTSGFEIIRWICDTTYKPMTKVPPRLEAVQAMLAGLGVDRGYNNFVDHFDGIMDGLFDLKAYKIRGKIDDMQVFLKEYRSCIFSQYLSLPNRSLLVLEESNMGSYVDPIVTGAVDAIRTMVSIDSPLSSFSVRVKENRVVKSLAQLAEFYDGMRRTTLAKKEGIYRKHVFGTRLHFSFRAVISSLTAHHRYDEVHIPWGIGMSVFRVHLVNKLFKRGYTVNQALSLINEHAQKYHPLFDELFNELISEAPAPGPAIVLQRNPSLERASAQAMFITKVKTDVEIPTVSMSILSVVGFNADFDGDQLNATLSLDLDTAEALTRLAPHKSTFDLNEPRRVAKNLSIPKPVIATIAQWLHHADGIEADPDKLSRMAVLAEV